MKNNNSTMQMTDMNNNPISNLSAAVSAILTDETDQFAWKVLDAAIKQIVIFNSKIQATANKLRLPKSEMISDVVSALDEKLMANNCRIFHLWEGRPNAYIKNYINRCASNICIDKLREPNNTIDIDKCPNVDVEDSEYDPEVDERIAKMNVAICNLPKCQRKVVETWLACQEPLDNGKKMRVEDMAETLGMTRENFTMTFAAAKRNLRSALNQAA